MPPLSFIVRFVVILCVYGALNYYVWIRLVRRPAWPRPWSGIATVLFVLLAVGTPAMVAAMRLGAPVGAMRLPAGVWMGWAFFVLFFFLCSDLARGAAWLAGKLRSRPAPLDPSRRQLLSRALAGGGAALAAGLAGAGMRTARAGARVERVQVQLPRLPAAMAGFTVAQLSDLHVGQLIGKADVEVFVAQVNALKPDLVVITGDLVDGSPAALGAAVTPLARLESKFGVYFVTGNHDYYSRAEPWIVFLRKLGIRVLRNERVRIGSGDRSFDLAGVEDPVGARFGSGPDLERALRGRDARRELILLAHRPRQIHQAARLGVGLQLSGHTHGGQFMPLSFFAPLVFPHVAGLHRHGAAQIYVNRGAGFVGVPIRLGVPAEITLLELRRGRPAAA